MSADSVDVCVCVGWWTLCLQPGLNDKQLCLRCDRRQPAGDALRELWRSGREQAQPHMRRPEGQRVKMWTPVERAHAEKHAGFGARAPQFLTPARYSPFKPLASLSCPGRPGQMSQMHTFPWINCPGGISVAWY